MLYAALTFWLLVAVMTASGVHQLWSTMLKPRTVNSILLPGTLVAQLGHVLGLLVTGATVEKTSLYKDDESGAPEMTRDPKPRIPLVGPLVIGMLPLVACLVALFLTTDWLGAPVLAGVNATALREAPPMALSAFWEMMRSLLTLMETLLSTILQADWHRWQVGLFVYLLVCLTVRMAPFPGTFRGTLGATIVVGIVGALTLQAAGPAEDRMETIWTVLGLAVGTLFLLLLASLIIRGVLSLGRLLAGNK